MKRIATALCAYGAFLILAGLAGYLSNPEKAKTALMSGGTFGLLNLGLGWLALRGWRPTRRVALAVAGFLGAVFVWRATGILETFPPEGLKVDGSRRRSAGETGRRHHHHRDARRYALLDPLPRHGR